MEELTKNGIFMAENKETQQLKLFVIGPLSHPENYAEVFFDLGNLWEKYPMIEVNINTPGGDMDSLEELLNGLAKYEHVTTIGRGTIASAGFILWASGDTRVVGKYSKYMAHRESSSMGGFQKTGESLHYLTTIDGMYTEMYKEYLSPILTEEEMKMAEVTEVYLPYTTLLERGVCMDEKTYMSLSDKIKSEEVVNIGGETYLFNPQVGGWIKINITVDEENPEVITSILHKMHEPPVVGEIEIDPSLLDEDGEVNEEKVLELLEAAMKAQDESDDDAIELVEAVEDVIDEAEDVIDSEDEDEAEVVEAVDEIIELAIELQDDVDDEIEELESAIQEVIKANEVIAISTEKDGEKVDVYIDELIEEVEESDLLDDPVLHSIASGVISNLIQTDQESKNIRATVDYLGNSFTIDWNREFDTIEINKFVPTKKMTSEEREAEIKRVREEAAYKRKLDFEAEVARSTEILEQDYNIHDLMKDATAPKSSTRLEGEEIEEVLGEVDEEVLADLSKERDKVQNLLSEVYKSKKEQEDLEDEDGYSKRMVTMEEKSNLNYEAMKNEKNKDHKDFVTLDSPIYVSKKLL